MIQIALLLITLALAIVLSAGMWVVGVVPFDPWTSALHVASIYIGVAGILIFQRYWKKNE